VHVVLSAIVLRTHANRLVRFDAWNQELVRDGARSRFELLKLGDEIFPLFGEQEDGHDIKLAEVSRKDVFSVKS